MRYADGTYDLTIDDIHEIRENTSKLTKKMSFEELKDFYDNAEKRFFNNSNIRKNTIVV